MPSVDAKSPSWPTVVGYGAQFVPDEILNTIATPEREADFAAPYIARRYRLSPLLARAIAVLAGLGGVFG
jgi:hypothetical protein